MTEPLIDHGRVVNILLAKALSILRGETGHPRVIRAEEGELLIVPVIQYAESLGYMVKDLRFRRGLGSISFNKDLANLVRILPSHSHPSSPSRLTVHVNTTGLFAGSWTFHLDDEAHFVITHEGLLEPPMSPQVAGELLRGAVISALARSEPRPTP